MAGLNAKHYITNVCNRCSSRNDIYSSLCSCGNSITPLIDVEKLKLDLDELVLPDTIGLKLEGRLTDAIKSPDLRLFVLNQMSVKTCNTLERDLLNFQKKVLDLSGVIQINGIEEVQGIISKSITNIRKSKKKMTKKYNRSSNPIKAAISEYSDLLKQFNDFTAAANSQSKFDDKIKPIMEETAGKLKFLVGEFNRQKLDLQNLKAVEEDFEEFLDSIEFMEKVTPELFRMNIEYRSFNLTMLKLLQFNFAPVQSPKLELPKTRKLRRNKK